MSVSRSGVSLNELRHRDGTIRCCSCGRVGRRGFKVIQEATHEPTGAVLGPFVVCASEKACRGRWPKTNYMGSE